MSDREDCADKAGKELKIELEEVKSLFETKSKLLEANIRELNSIYAILNEKLKEIRRRDKRIEEFEESLMRANKLSTVGEMASAIAHEIKNPLISIQGFAKRIGKVREPEKIERYAKFIDKEAGRLTTVLMKLLEFSRMDRPHREYVDLNELVDDTILFIEYHLARFRNVRLSVEKTDGLPLLEIDKIHIQQALTNIIMNAAQAMPEGGTIRITTGRSGDSASISVIDEGVGVRKETLEKIFDSFFTTKSPGEGTGIGLSLSKRLVEANEGKIEVQSEEGKGSTFKILFKIPTASRREPQ